MANSCSTDHNCKFNNNMVLIFQDMNVAKSAPSALLTIYQKSMYPPKVVKKPPFRQIMQNSPTISRFGPRELEPQISQQIARNSLNSPTTTANHAKSARFLLNIYHSLFFSVPQLFTAKLAKSAQFANP